MTLSLFAFLDDVQKSIQQFIHNCLLVAGAFLVGYILGGIIGWALGKWAFKQKSPDTLKHVGRPIGGIVLALIVATAGLYRHGRPARHGRRGSRHTQRYRQQGFRGQPRSSAGPEEDPPRSIRRLPRRSSGSPSWLEPQCGSSASSICSTTIQMPSHSKN